MENQELLEKMAQAELVLAGLGEEFDGAGLLRQNAEYGKGCEALKAEGLHWLIPAWNEYCLRRWGDGRVDRALDRLEALLEGKNYFAVSVSANSRIARMKRAVMPCGSILCKQCSAGCPGVLSGCSEEDAGLLEDFFRETAEGHLPDRDFSLGVCPECGKKLVLNNIYAENYNEEGYLEQWRLYTKWLQGTLNHRLLVLELGVGMRFPSVIRWPFEKTAFFNQKAFFCRVNGKLYQLTKELAEKGCGISMDAVDWLAGL